MQPPGQFVPITDHVFRQRCSRSLKHGNFSARICASWAGALICSANCSWQAANWSFILQEVESGFWVHGKVFQSNAFHRRLPSWSVKQHLWSESPVWILPILNPAQKANCKSKLQSAGRYLHHPRVTMFLCAICAAMIFGYDLVPMLNVFCKRWGKDFALQLWCNCAERHSMAFLWSWILRFLYHRDYLTASWLYTSLNEGEMWRVKLVLKWKQTRTLSRNCWKYRWQSVKLHFVFSCSQSPLLHHIQCICFMWEKHKHFRYVHEGSSIWTSQMEWGHPETIQRQVLQLKDGKKHQRRSVLSWLSLFKNTKDIRERLLFEGLWTHRTGGKDNGVLESIGCRAIYFWGFRMFRDSRFGQRAAGPEWESSSEFGVWCLTDSDHRHLWPQISHCVVCCVYKQ